ncbi:F-box/LRR-repeat protein At2g29930-like [Brassica rapa]|uniref:F-box/LRR-repeat protein At2g29930-like n=1 Tax=Brassica campestris TaxID=3711 RepID=UPI0004F1B878|nr:F-box/LRR-repeat protein At2g29930-like [Brassica rapa]
MSPQRDSISSLPDEVLGKVLSLLPTNQAATASVLSKRWMNLLALVDNLAFSDESDPRGFCDFVDKTLVLILTNSSIIKRFSLRCEHRHDSCRADNWIRTVLERSFLELHLDSVYKHVIETKSFRSNTLVKLTLSNEFVLDGHFLPPRGVMLFPKLKTLSLLSVVSKNYEVYEYLISACPVLEELILLVGAFPWLKFSHSITVLNPSVKRLTISYPYRCYRKNPDIQMFQTPSLVYLDYSSSFVEVQYHVGFSLVVEARLDLIKERFSTMDDYGGDDSDSDSDSDGGDVLHDVTNLVEGISNVKTLHLSPNSLQAFHFYCKPTPVFHKLLTLSFESDKEKGWQVVPLLLNNSLNLETLVIKGLVHRVTDKCGDACVCIAREKKKKKMKEEEVCCLSTCQVKVLKILGYGGTSGERKQMKHFLGNLKCLETVRVGVQAENQQEENNVNNHYLRITNALTKLPRVSSNCQIHFF